MFQQTLNSRTIFIIWLFFAIYGEIYMQDEEKISTVH